MRDCINRGKAYCGVSLVCLPNYSGEQTSACCRPGERLVGGKCTPPSPAKRPPPDPLPPKPNPYADNKKDTKDFNDPARACRLQGGVWQLAYENKGPGKCSPKDQSCAARGQTAHYACTHWKVAAIICCPGGTWCDTGAKSQQQFGTSSGFWGCVIPNPNQRGDASDSLFTWQVEPENVTMSPIPTKSK